MIYDMMDGLHAIYCRSIIFMGDMPEFYIIRRIREAATTCHEHAPTSIFMGTVHGSQKISIAAAKFVCNNVRRVLQQLATQPNRTIGLWYIECGVQTPDSGDLYF